MPVMAVWVANNVPRKARKPKRYTPRYHNLATIIYGVILILAAVVLLLYMKSLWSLQVAQGYC